ncbi:MAG: hypothetical protein ACYC8S_00935 [Minisyncoccota bacterium]
MIRVTIIFTSEASLKEVEVFQESIKGYLKETLPEQPSYEEIWHPRGMKPQFIITVKEAVGNDFAGFKSYVQAMQAGLRREGKIRDIIIYDFAWNL